MARAAAGITLLFAVVATACGRSEAEVVPGIWPSWLRECTHANMPARCGTVEVPESPSAPGSRRLPIRVVVLVARPDRPTDDPVVALVGGPGQAATESAGQSPQRLQAYGQIRDVVLIDQRGTGEAHGLHCPPPASATDLMGRVFDPARLTSCRDELAARADLTKYTTSLAAGDYARILDRLPYRQVNLWGVSYGTRLALEIARRTPDRVRAMILDAVVPTDFTWPTTAATDLDAGLDAVAGDCARDPQCSAAFPDVGGDIAAAFAGVRLGASAVVPDPATGTTGRVPFGASDLAYAARGLLYNNGAWSLPLFFREARRGQYEAFAEAYVNRARTLDRTIARGVHLGVYCAEDLPFVDWTRAEAAAAPTRLGAYLLDEYRRACEIWPRGTPPADFRAPITVNVPTLLLSGRRDPVTPPWTAEQVVRTLSRSRVVVWPFGGHGVDGLVSADCRGRLVAEFLRTADPDQLPLACTTQDPVRSFWLSR